MTREIERLYRDANIMDGSGPGGLSSDPEKFAAAIDAPLNILSHIAANFPDRASRRSFVEDVVRKLHEMVKARVAGHETLH
jgi:hypothetical protein